MHEADKALVAECARLTEHIQLLELRVQNLATENGNLRARVEEVTARGAHSRDSVVKIRGRLREVREQRRQLRKDLVEAIEANVLDKRASEAYASGMDRAARASLHTVLAQLQERAREIGSAAVLLELDQELAREQVAIEAALQPSDEL